MSRRPSPASTGATSSLGPPFPGGGPRGPAEIGSLVVDWTRCDGHGLCRSLLPDRVVLDEWGFPILHDTPVTEDGEPDVRRAVAACPALALRLER